MYKTKDGRYKCYKRNRVDGWGDKFTELLFLQQDIPLKLVEETDNKPGVYIKMDKYPSLGIEDNSIDITMLGEKFKARIVRPYGHWFFGQQSYGVEISILLSEYFDIEIYKLHLYSNIDKNYFKIAYSTSSVNFYCYNLKRLSKGIEGKPINVLERDCPLKNNSYEREDAYMFALGVESCFTCPYLEYNNGSKCRCPKLKWRE